MIVYGHLEEWFREGGATSAQPSLISGGAYKRNHAQPPPQLPRNHAQLTNDYQKATTQPPPYKGRVHGCAKVRPYEKSREPR